MDVKSFIKKIPFAKAVYHSFLNFKNAVEAQYRGRLFKENGIFVLKEVQSILEGTGCFFFIDMGTLLGIYRDGHLLKRDMDIDVGVRIQSDDEIASIKNILISKGLKHTICFKTDCYGEIQNTFYYRGVRIDISYYRHADNQDICYLLYGNGDIVKLSCHHIESTNKHPFEDFHINIPTDASTYLSDRYGQNWRIPDPRYIYWKGPSATPVAGKGLAISIK